MKKLIFDSEATAASYIVDTFQQVLAQKPDGLFCLAAGHSSLRIFSEILLRGLDLSRARFVGLDEWLGVHLDADGSCASFLKINFFDASGVRAENLRLFDSLAADPQEECLAVEATIDRWGGIDYLLLGMGMNGHLALNEPGNSLDLGAHVAPIDRTTQQVAVKYFKEGMPAITHGITLGIKNILAARKIQLAIFGEHKAPPVERLLSYSAPSEDFPATALLSAKDAELILDKKAAGA